MNDVSSIRTKTYDTVKDDPLYLAWVQADSIYRSVSKRFAAEYTKRVEAAKAEIHAEVGKLFAVESKLAGTAVSEAFQAYTSVYKEHPPCPMEGQK